jgi:hypothetical protein
LGVFLLSSSVLVLALALAKDRVAGPARPQDKGCCLTSLHSVVHAVLSKAGRPWASEDRHSREATVLPGKTKLSFMDCWFRIATATNHTGLATKA